MMMTNGLNCLTPFIGLGSHGVYHSDGIGTIAQRNLGFAIANHMDMRWIMILKIDDDTQRTETNNCRHLVAA